MSRKILRGKNKQCTVKEAGSILILSLWIFTLFGLLALSLAFRGRLEIKISAIRESKGAVPYSLLSAVHAGALRLRADKAPEIDSIYDSWYGEGTQEKKKPDEKDKKDKKEPAGKDQKKDPKEQAGKETKDQSQEALGWLDDPIRKLTYSVFIDDEESRLNINTVPAQVLEKFFELLKQEEGEKILSDPEALIGGILYWRGHSWHKKEEQKGVYYKKKPFESLEELFLIPGVKKEDIPFLMSYFTVFPQGDNTSFTININTVPALILKAVIQAIPSGPDSKERVYEQILAFREGKLPGQGQGANLKKPDLQPGGRPRLGWQGAGGPRLGRMQSAFEFSLKRRELPPEAGPGPAGKEEPPQETAVPKPVEPKKYFVESDLDVMYLLYMLELPNFGDLVAVIMQLVPSLTVDSKHFRVRAKVSGPVLKDFGAEVILGSDQEILAWQRI